ncbi:MAG: hypothetical protein PHY93_09210 [Bacteriovorax sp.]|nr:hypothetical protein [Bacteriovorax sp.]
MNSAALIFFILAFLTVFLGAYETAGISIGAYKALAIVFLALGVLSYAGSLVNQRKNQMS